MGILNERQNAQMFSEAFAQAVSGILPPYGFDKLGVPDFALIQTFPSDIQLMYRVAAEAMLVAGMAVMVAKAL